MKFDLTSAVVLPGLVATNELIKEATRKKSVIISNGNNKIVINNKEVEVTGSNIKLVSDSVTVISRDFKVEGNITYTGACKKG